MQNYTPCSVEFISFIQVCVCVHCQYLYPTDKNLIHCCDECFHSGDGIWVPPYEHCTGTAMVRITPTIYQNKYHAGFTMPWKRQLWSKVVRWKFAIANGKPQGMDEAGVVLMQLLIQHCTVVWWCELLKHTVYNVDCKTSANVKHTLYNNAGMIGGQRTTHIVQMYNVECKTCADVKHTL